MIKSADSSVEQPWCSKHHSKPRQASTTKLNHQELTEEGNSNSLESVMATAVFIIYLRNSWLQQKHPISTYQESCSFNLLERLPVISTSNLPEIKAFWLRNCSTKSTRSALRHQIPTNNPLRNHHWSLPPLLSSTTATKWTTARPTAWGPNICLNSYQK